MPHQGVEHSAGLAGIVRHRVGQRGLNDAVGEVVGEFGHVMNGFGLGDPLADHGSGHSDDDGDDQRRQRDREQQSAQGHRLGCGALAARLGQHNPVGGRGRSVASGRRRDLPGGARDFWRCVRHSSATSVVVTAAVVAAAVVRGVGVSGS